ncbi:hypothetical protein BVRB_023820, partial [Beta vulgaris subsp. vulgaris]
NQPSREGPSNGIIPDDTRSHHEHGESSNQPGQGGPDPFGLPRNNEEVRKLTLEAWYRSIFGDGLVFSNPDNHVDPMRYATSCSIWANIMSANLTNRKLIDFTGGKCLPRDPVAKKRALDALHIELSKKNRAVVVELKCDESGDHFFLVTGHGDAVLIAHGWQNNHTVRYERPMGRNRFFELMRMLMMSDDPKCRLRANEDLFHASPYGGTDKVRIESLTSGDIGDPIIHRDGVDRSVPGIHQDRDPRFDAQRPHWIHHRSYEEGGNQPGAVSDVRKEEHPIELCDFCKPRGRACCMRCLR